MKYKWGEKYRWGTKIDIVESPCRCKPRGEGDENACEFHRRVCYGDETYERIANGEDYSE